MSLPKKLTNFSRAEFDDTCRRRFFFGPSFDPYGGTAGLYDLGPPLCAMKANLLTLWRSHFVIEEGMAEVDTTCLTPEEVFVASGHVKRFNDVMVRDTVTGECLRVDKYLEEYSEAQAALPSVSAERKAALAKLAANAEVMSVDELRDSIKSLGILSSKQNPLSEPFPFNLMLSTAIGPEGTKKGYMRPELAQGIILNFRRLVDAGHAPRMPFAAAAIGSAFRNEIAPRAALLRVREFTLAEIEHFMNPNEKRHPKLAEVAQTSLFLLSRDVQESGGEPLEMTVGEAVSKKVIDNETLAYFIARTQQFMSLLGLKYIRFRQHRRNEMAHYAQDCWDCELLTSYGWTECVGLADRSAYDLTCHSAATGKELCAREEFSEPQIVRVLAKRVNKGVAGKAWGKETAAATQAIEALSETEALAFKSLLETEGVATITTSSGATVTVNPGMVVFEYRDDKIHGRNYTPSVVEPSFGVGRILYACLEQAYWVRRDDTGKNDKRAVFSLAPVLAPYKVAVLPLMTKPQLLAEIEPLRKMLVARGVTCRTDDSGAAIGKKYARIDELGVPYCITIDLQGDGTVTLRERDSGQQVRIPQSEVANVVAELCQSGTPITWNDVKTKFPEQQSAM